METRSKRRRTRQRDWFDTNMDQDPVTEIAGFLEDVRDRSTLRKLPLTRTNEVVCLPSGRQLGLGQPQPVFRTVPGAEGCEPLTTPVRGCCQSNLQFTLSVATIMRSGTAPPIRIPTEMMLWVDGLYNNSPQFLPPDTVFLDFNVADDRLLWEFIKQQKSRVSAELQVRGNQVDLGPRMWEMKCNTLRIVGDPNSNTTLAPRPFVALWAYNVIRRPNGLEIPTLFLDDCTVPSFPVRGVIAPTPLQVFYNLLFLLVEAIPMVGLTLPWEITYLQLIGYLINVEDWQPDPEGGPPTYTYGPGENEGETLVLQYFLPNRVTVRNTSYI